MRDVARFLTPDRFLKIAGTILILLGLAGLTGLLGQISSARFFHPPYWINWIHFMFGTVLLIVAFVGGPRLQNAFALTGATVGTTIGLLGLLFGARAATAFGIPELADPSDHIAHLTVGLVAFWAWTNRPATSQGR
jgi:hypothetical protein